MKIEKNINGIKDLCLITPELNSQVGINVLEVYNQIEFLQNRLSQQFVQDNQVYSKKCVLRGMHVNIKHPQGKLIRVIHGEIYDVVVDLRKNSSTYKKWVGVEISEKNRKELYIPQGMGHGYLALEDSLVSFKVTTHYIAGDEVGFSWNSPELGIVWPQIENIIQNETDRLSKPFTNEILRSN